MTRFFWLYFICDSCKTVLMADTPRVPTETGLLKVYGWTRTGSRSRGLERHRCPECSAKAAATPNPFAPVTR